ncbi:MAG TPA: preprotein translocase subunit SecA [Planctomycetota bacterium]|nr:preprotein translocase subunit SecA [Planctomycetota bacterium]HRR81131.1 preprotein translocase subunit SecA [Planctomycetota bacterium]
MMGTDADERAGARARVPRRYRRVVRRVAEHEARLRALSPDELRGLARAWRARFRTGASLEALLPEVFAAVRECARRTIGLRHFDVQIVGGWLLHRGRVVEMQTGEGKTLVATLPAALNAIPGKGVHVVTVNDYLASRDRDWMAPVYEGLGFTVGCIQTGLSQEQRRAAYACDITYGTNKEFGFDFLRDQVRRRAVARGLGDVLRRWDIEHGDLARTLGYAQRGHAYAIVDEVDSVLIDEARVPLILSDAAGQPSPFAAAYRWADEVARRMRPLEDFTFALKEQKVELTQTGRQRVRDLVGLLGAAPPADRPVHVLIEQAIRAHRLFTRDREYLLQDDKVVIVDEFTGRVLPDRNWQLGLHQAIQAKEGLPITDETHTLATVTYQRYFRLYRKLAGMTGTAIDARREFRRVYGLRVARVPTNRPLRRIVMPDVVFRSRHERLRGVLARIQELHARGRPVLVGTRSVDKSEELSRALERLGIAHSVLNAKKHAEEAAIVAQAGQRGQVTICTNMAGRGTDIVLGPGVAELGGLHVLGTERHDASRIDRQLGGRAGRQGDPGSYQFMVALDDDLVRRRYRRLTLWLRRLTRRRRGRGSRSFVLRWLFSFAQARVEHDHLMARVALMDRDKWLDDVHDLFGVSPHA